jgi:hypothetical protein
VLADAQAAEARGEKAEAVTLLKRAAEIYRDAGNHNRALKMLRHIRRLEGLDELEVLEGGEQPEVPGRRRRVIEERGPQLADPALDAWCSFCCRPKGEAGALVSGPTGSFICASCLGAAQGFLSPGASTSGAGPSPRAAAVAGTASPNVRELLPHQRTAAERLSRGNLGLLLGPQGSGKSTVLAALEGPVVSLELDAPLAELPAAPRVVLAVRAVAPEPVLKLRGQPVWDTATLLGACGAWVPEAVLARVDAVAVLPPFDAAALRALALSLGVTEGTEPLVELALKSPAPARELCALVARSR